MTVVLAHPPILTPRLRLDPLAPGDIEPLAETVFSDPEVMRHLAHDMRAPDAARHAAARWACGPGSPFAAVWNGGGLGPFAIRSRSPALAPPGRFLGVSGFYLPRDGDRLSGEFFHALGRAWHGRGIGTEAARAAVAAARRRGRLGTVYAVCWDRQNPASVRVLRRAGFRPSGRIELLEEYSAERLEGIRAWELARFAAQPAAARTRDAAVTAGKLAIIGRELGAARAWLDRLLELTPTAGHDAARQSFAVEVQTVGLAYLLLPPR
ncbi:GNAT family N-acetyltransferase [Rhodobacteraceae bacterium 2CG4]|uniref:GNAT family N-acetyltransferase n=1 Tax=Halovulum marinum TaxID=2662447 RepID=A0A6L5YV74_9RHOB|nr:GNAT family N-acetyltransferase [Halovulum marinum]MSU88233.1 GNAT family N-acetyltransferase [Halovulum marinum]